MRFSALQILLDAPHRVFRIEPRCLQRIFFTTDSVSYGSRDDADVPFRLSCDGSADRAAMRMSEHDSQRYMEMMRCILDTGKLMCADDASRRTDDKQVAHIARENRLRNHA